MHWRRAVAILAAAPLCAALDMPVGFFHGSFTALDGTALAGQLTARASDGSLQSCGYDARSYFERAKLRIAPLKLLPGDPIEVLADHRPGSRSCYARIVHVVIAQPARDPRRAAVAPVRSSRLAELFPRGDRNLSGIVIQRDAASLTLKTRAGQRTLVLGPETRYLENGLRLDAAQPPVNTHVFVRAGRNADGQVQAYQVMWGQIVNAP
jgi:hypothetical protein